MKILQESASSQTLKVIPRSYPSIVDVVITNEDTKTSVTYADLSSSSNLGYLEIPTVYTLEEDTFYSFEVWDKTDTGYNMEFDYTDGEYISSPDQSYLGNDITGLDIEFRYNNIGRHLDISQGDYLIPATGFRIALDTINKTITFACANNTETAVTLGDLPNTGTIKITSDGSFIYIWLDGIIVKTEAVTDADISALSGELLFAATNIGGAVFPVLIGGLSYVKLNDHVWTFPEGTGSTTTNSESVVSTLNSDVSTEAMWGNKSYEQNEIIYKGKIFCTNQDSYSINDGGYTTRSRNNKYTTYE